MYFPGHNPKIFVSGWSQHISPEGRIYYYNERTNESSWEKPDELKTPSEKLLSQCPWKEYKADNGKTYYHNLITKESAWIIPKELEELKSKVEAELELEKLKTTSKQKTDNANIINKIDEINLTTSNDDNTTNINEENKSNITTPNLFNGSPKDCLNKNNSTDQKDPKDLMEIFRELMRDKNVSSNVSWEFALKSISSDPRYELFRHHPERKQMFNAYKTQKAKEEREEQRLKAKKARESLEKYLQSSSVMNSNVRYRQAIELFRDNEFWKAVPDSDRREIFEDVIRFLSDKEKNEAKNLRKRNMNVLADILDSMPSITYQTLWQEAQQLLLDNPIFANDSALLNMDKEDALVIFTEHIRQLEQEEEEEKKNEKKRLIRQKRKNREQFLDFLNELHCEGKLTSMSKWCHLYQEISADPRYTLMLSHVSGSTALDLFKFYVDDLQIKYDQEKQIIKSILKDKQYQIFYTTTFDEFNNVLKDDERSLKFNSANIKLVFDKLLEKAKDIEKERSREVNKLRRKLELQFINLLAKIEPPITEETTWEEIRPKVSEDTVSNRFTEPERIQLFNSYRQSMEDSCFHHHSKSRKQKKLKKTKQVRSSSSSNSSGMELESEDEEHSNSASKKFYKHKKSRSHSGSLSSHRRSRSRSPIYEKHRKHRRHEHSGSGYENNDDDNDNPDDLEELEKQRQLLLQQLAAHD